MPKPDTPPGRTSPLAAGRLCFAFCLLLFAVGVYHVATWPVAATDTDLWYHLTGGRYFVETGSVARTSFFSFITPERVWVNYYWAFQVLVHRVFAWSGYPGLIWLRTVLFCATILMILLYFSRGRKEAEARLYYTVLFVFYLLLLLPRSLPVRPHLFSYLFIVTFLHVLETDRQRPLFLLPGLGILWVNLHGIEYPVMLLICGAYLAEWLYESARGQPGQTARAYTYPLLVVAAAASALCTPHGVHLLPVPFTSIAGVAQFIYELRPLTLYDFISFFGVLLIVIGLAAVTAIRTRRFRLSHMFLLCGGLLLLFKGKRFVNEFVLLALPLLRDCIPAMAAASRTKVLRPAAALLVGLFLFMPFFFMHYFFAHPPRYPVSARELPEGVSLFLKEHHAAGALLNHPNSGGYLQWTLYPQCRIFMDMQVPFLFTDADFAAARGAYAERPVLRKFIDRYRPAFITVPIEMEGFRSMIVEHPQYRMVFFDDAEVLYVDSAQERALAETYEIRTVDPFTLYREPMGPRLTGGPALDELKRLAGMFPAGGIVNASLAAYFLSEARYREAITCAEVVIRTYPESHLGYKLKADALARLDRCGEAIQCYTKALQRSDGELRALIEKEAASCSRRSRGSG